jgi:hypothetical protein
MAAKTVGAVPVETDENVADGSNRSEAVAGTRLAWPTPQQGRLTKTGAVSGMDHSKRRRVDSAQK